MYFLSNWLDYKASYLDNGLERLDNGPHALGKRPCTSTLGIRGLVRVH